MRIKKGQKFIYKLLGKYDCVVVADRQNWNNNWEFIIEKAIAQGYNFSADSVTKITLLNSRVDVVLKPYTEGITLFKRSKKGVKNEP